MESWHESDEFWETIAPMLFDEQRLAATPLEVDLVTARLNLDPRAAVLDLCCGPGRHSLELARCGFQVTGVDRTAAYLEKARGIADEEGLEVKFLEADMREFVRAGVFDAAIMMYTSFGYFEDPDENRQVLVNVCRSLRDGGALLIEMMGKEVLARIFQPQGWHEQDDVLFLQERKLSKDWSWIDNRWILIRGQERVEFNISHWLYSAAELSALLKESGFQSVEFFGDLEGVPYDQDAKRLIAVARK